MESFDMRGILRNHDLKSFELEISRWQATQLGRSNKDAVILLKHETTTVASLMCV